MPTTLVEERRGTRLNPFFFPSDTDFRFVLLALAVLGATLFTYNLIWNHLGENTERYRQRAVECLARPEASFAVMMERSRTGQEVEPAGLCMAPVNRSIVRLGLTGSVLVFSLAGLGYWLLPAWRRRRGRLTPITAEDVGEIADELQALAKEAGLRRPPTFVWNPLALGGTPLAFGNLGERFVYLPTGLIQEFYGDRELFRAVVLHELAHLRNADVDKTFLSIFLWRSFLVAAVLPYLVIGLDQLTLSDVGGLGWRMLAIAGLVLLVRNSVLRAREVYADVRVSTWESRTEPLERALAAEPAPTGTALWKRILATHPPQAVRRTALRDTRAMFEMSPWDAAATGAVVALAIPHVFRTIQMVDLSGLAVTSPLITGLILSPLVVGVLGTGVWRETLASRVLGTPAPRFDRLASGFAAGAAVGSAVSLSSWVGFAEQAPAAIAGLLLWAALMALSLRPLLRWMAEGARAWFEVAARSRSPRAVALVGLTLATVVVTLWLGLVVIAHPIEGLSLGLVSPGLMSVLASPFAAVAGMLFILPAPLLLLVAVGLWLYPVLPLALHPRAVLAPRWDWAFLSDAPHAVPATPRTSSLGAAARAAARTAALYALLLVAVRLWFRLGVSMPQERKAIVLTLLLASLAALLQALLARRVARAALVVPAATGLFAAFLAGVLMLAAFHLVNLLLFQGGIEWAFVWNTVQLFIGTGTLLSLMALIRRRAPSVSPEPGAGEGAPAG